MALSPLPSWLHEQGGAVFVAVLVVPRSSHCRIVAVHDDRLKIQLTAPPVDGKANAALVQFLASELDIAKAQIEIVGGAANKRKNVRISGVPAQRVLLRLLPQRQ